MLPLLFATIAMAEPPTVVDANALIVIDGVLDEEDWSRAEPVTEFARFQPAEGGSPSGTTEVRFLQDEKYLYVSARVTGTDDPVRGRVSPREAINQDDQIGIYLDTFKDERSGYIFYLNAIGIQQDIRFNNGQWEPSWSTLFKSRGVVDEDGHGFTIEVAFPWRSLKYPSTDGEQTWGVMLTRKIPSEGAKYGYPHIERGHPRQFQQAASLMGVKPSNSGSGLELIPQVTAVQQGQRVEPTDSLVYNGFDEPLNAVRPSIDARYGLTPNVTIAGTVNPDFSQVESDVTRIDLNQRFAFSYPERRPFFTEGGDFFRDQANTLYSRSIVEPIYGTKITGREGPVSVAVLHALDRSPLAAVHQFGSPSWGEDDITDDDLVATSVTRLRTDAFGGGYAGVTFADKRSLDGDSTHNTGAVDASVPLGERWTATMMHNQSTTGGLWGMENRLGISRATGKKLGLSASFADTTPGYRQETGFRTQSGTTAADVSTNYTIEPGGRVDVYTPTIGAFVSVDRHGLPDQVENAPADHLLVAWTEHAVTVAGIHKGSASFGVADHVEQSLQIQGFRASASLGANLSTALSYNVNGVMGREIDYQTLSAAMYRRGTVSTTVRPVGPLRIDLTLNGQQMVPEGGDARLSALMRARVGWQFTRTLGLRVIEDWSRGTTFDGVLLSSVLLTWLKNPGTAVYVGYTERTDVQGSASAIDRTVFAKASVLLRP